MPFMLSTVDRYHSGFSIDKDDGLANSGWPKHLRRSSLQSVQCWLTMEDWALKISAAGIIIIFIDNRHTQSQVLRRRKVWIHSSASAYGMTMLDEWHSVSLIFRPS